MIGTARAWFAAAALAALLVLVGPAVAHPPKPTAPNAAVSDGCQRSDLGIGFDTSPEWVYVYRSPAIRMATGVVRVSHASLEDSILQHRSLDFNGNLVADAPSRYLIAGSPSQGTNNYAPDEGERRGRLHFEWESQTLPFFAWPSDGDRATLWGSWIWDCGHWQSTANNTGGATTGEHSELHPLSGIAVTRRASYLSRRGETETDAFISNEGDASHAVEQCALTHHPVSGTAYPQYDSGFKACATDPANRIQPLARSYTFFAPAPPRPSPTAVIRFRILTRIPGSSGIQHVRVLHDGLLVTVKLGSARHVVRYGRSFFVSWTAPAPHPPTALEVTFKSILINHADPNPAVPDPSGAHWSLYLDLNGYWQLLNKWASALTTHVTDNERITINHTVKIWVPRGAAVSLLVQGRECDEPAGKTILGNYANLLYPCPANTDEQNPNLLDLFANDDPGTILTIYRSSGAALGSHVASSAATVNFPGTGPTSFGDVPGQGQGDYTLTYTVKRAAR
ncbi:MAG TPA: hypothetical protein VKQ71_03005 [Acidimicrobiales bacterium]|nr:hypothetical protein [Acidimicrobiales bacterium]